MIKHIVFFKINAEKKEKELSTLKEMIENLGDLIPSIIKIEAGLNFSPRENAYDIALVAEFKNKEGLEEYQIHPDHVKLIEHLKKLDREIAVVDYNTSVNDEL